MYSFLTIIISSRFISIVKVFISPAAYSYYMQPEQVLSLRGRADGEGVPLIACDTGYLNKDIVSWLISEALWSRNGEMSYLLNNIIIKQNI